MARIAIFDSGVGGLSIYQAVRARLPAHQYLFVSDNQAHPYGTKEEGELRKRVLQVVARLNRQYQPDLLIIACNTASTVALPALRERHDFPIVGVVPAIKPAAKTSKTKRIGLLATPATIKRRYTQDLIQQYAADCEVMCVGSSDLVQIAEQKLHGKEPDLSRVRHVLKPFLIDGAMDVLVLACTHFPLLNKEIKSIFNVNNREIELVDSSVGIANRTAYLLETTGYVPSARLNPKLKKEVQIDLHKSIAAFTDGEVGGNFFRESLHRYGFDSIETLV